MKRIGWLFLAVVMMAWMVGCKSNKNDDIDVTGSWGFVVNWSSTGAGSFSMVIYPDGSVVTSPNRHLGTWVLNKDDITINIESGLAVYIGSANSDGDSMSGTMTNNSGGSGTWSATLASRTTPAMSISRSAAGLVKDPATGL